MSTTNGTGGVFTDARNRSFVASNGYGCLYHRFAAGLDPAKPVGVLVWIHGDGAAEFDNPDSSDILGGPNGVIATAKKHNLIVVVPQTPDDDPAGDRTWWMWGSYNTVVVQELVDVWFYQQFNIDLTKVWLAGFSGGAEFITSLLLPYQGNLMRIEGGGFVLFGGGDADSAYGHSLDFVLPYRGKFPGTWYVGENDTAENSLTGFDGKLAAQRGHDFYASKGHSTKLETITGHSHNLTGLYGEKLRDAIFRAENVGKSVSDVFRAVYYGGQEIKGIYAGSSLVWEYKPIEIIYDKPTPLEMRNQMEGLVASYGLNHRTVTELPFNLDTSQVTNMSDMFYNFSSLTTVPEMDTSKVTNMSYMFLSCSSLTFVPDMDVSKVVNMHSMLSNCSSLYDGKVRLIRKDGTVPPQSTKVNMIRGSGLTREPFYDSQGDPIN